MRTFFILTISVLSFTTLSSKNNTRQICGSIFPCRGAEELTNKWIKELSSQQEFAKSMTKVFNFYDELQNVFKVHDLEPDFMFLSFVISKFNPFYSKDNGLGIWNIKLKLWNKFMSGVPPMARMDPIFSSIVVAKRLKELKRDLNDNALLVLAFLFGKDSLLNAIDEYKSKDIRIIANFYGTELRDRVLNAYPRFLAVRFLARKYLRGLIRGTNYVVLDHMLKDTSSIDLGINPLINYLKFVPSYYPIRVKQGMELKILSSDSASIQARELKYRVKTGDSLISIAKHFNVPVKVLMKQNEISSPNKIFAGQKLIIRKKQNNSNTSSDPLNLLKRWTPIYDTILQNNKLIYLKLANSVKTYSIHNIKKFPRPLLPSLASRNTCTVKELTKMEILNVYFYDKDQKTGLVYLAPWESVELLSNFLAYNLRDSNNIPYWDEPYYHALPVKFVKVSREEFLHKRRTYLIKLYNNCLEQYTLRGTKILDDLKFAKEYPSYMLVCYNPILLFLDITNVKKLVVPVLIKYGEVL